MGETAAHVGTKSRQDVDELALACRNWGRWGEDDELGTLNYLTPERVAAAARSVELGRIVPLAIPLDANGPQTGRFGRYNPQHFMLASGVDGAPGSPRAVEVDYADDVVVLPLQSGTQWDGLSHVFYDKKMWNGHPMELVNSAGASRNSVVAASSRFMGRGVLLDLAAHRRTEALGPGDLVLSAELEEVAVAQGVRVEEGDFVLLHTGWLESRRKQGWAGYIGDAAPGVGLETAGWFHRHRVAAVASDTAAVEVRPSEVPDNPMPWHQVVIANMGMSVGEMFDLCELAQVCRRLGRFTFLLVATGLPVTGAVGTPTLPLAVF